jgi:hypothetical protein
MRETATMTDDIFADMRALIGRIEEELQGKPPDACGLNLFVAMNDLSRCIYQHEADKRLGEIMRMADSFGKPPADRPSIA